MMAPKTIVLGDEYDARLRDALRAALVELGARTGDRSWGVGGSQEIQQLDVAIGERTLHVESETYIGLTIRGDAELVDRVADLVKRRMWLRPD
jgi:hypothetical protein